MHLKVLHIPFLFVFILGTLKIQAQTLVSGTVFEKSAKKGLYGATVGIKDGLDGASTDSLGRFSFTTDETGKQTLLISYIGFKPLEFPVEIGPNSKNIAIYLEEIPTDIREVVISAGAFEASDEKKGVVLSPLDIVTVPGANGDITGALNTLPGTTINGESGQLIVRGGAAGETRIYVDGLAVRNYYTSPIPDVPVRSRFSPFQFKGTTFASGGYSAEYGQALSSTLILQSPDMPTQGGTNINISCLGFGAGRTVIREKSALSVQAGYFNLAPYFAVFNQNIDFGKAPESGNFGLEGRQKTAKNGIIKYGGQSSFSHVQVTYPKGPYQSEAFTMGIKNQNHRAFVSWRQPLNSDWLIYTAAQAEANSDNFTPSSSTAFKINNFSTSGRAHVSWAPGTLFRLKTGVDLNFFKLSPTFLADPLRHDVGAVFSELETYVTDKFIVRGGLRGERDFLLKRNNLAPRLSTAYKVGRDAQLSASWGVFYQSPEDTLLYRGSDIGFEQAHHYIVNYQLARNSRIFRVETFYKKYDHLTRTVPEFNNSGNGYAQGVELFFRDRKSLQWGDYWISYSYLDTRRLHRWYPEKAMPEFAATHNASLVFKYFFSKKQISANASYTIQSGRPYYNPTNTQFLGDRTPIYQNFSVQMAKLTNLWGNFTIFVVSVNNILGIKQVFGYRYTAIPNTSPAEYYRQEIGPTAPRFVFLGCFMNIGDKRKKVTKHEALE